MDNLDKDTILVQIAEQFCPEHTEYIESPKLADSEEQRVVRQFVEALLYEEIIEFSSEARIGSPAEFNNFDAVFDCIFFFNMGGQNFRCLGARRIFERIRIADGSVQILEQARTAENGETRKHRETRKYRECRIEELICYLDTDSKAGSEMKIRVLGELMQTIALCRWNTRYLEHHKKPRRELNFAQLESAITEGHLYHPSFKARTGFTLQDHIQYGPEAGKTIQFEWLAIQSQRVEHAYPSAAIDFWTKELGEEQFTVLSKRLESLGKNWLSYSLVPIHPWQVNAIQDRGLADAIACGDIIELGKAGDFYQATQSLRTLVNVSHPEKAHVKIPLNLVSTSSHRNLQDHFVCTAPAISTWLQEVVAKDEYLQREGKLLLLSEYAGLLYKPEDEVKAKEMDGLIGAIFRESVVDKLQSGEEAIPFTALMLVESDNRPFIADWLDRYGVDAWVNRLLDVMLVPIWHMLVHNGIAFEAHCQNLILTHKDGWPHRIVLRDFHEDMEYVEDYLKSPEHLPKLAETDSYFETIALDEGFSMSDIDELRELFMDTVYVLNLADLSFLLERYHDYSEAQFWNRVRNHLNDYRQSGITDPARIDRIGAGNPNIIVESLLKKKILNGGTLDYFEHTVSNPLAANDEESAEDRALYQIESQRIN
jgi:siderophore synthetase component